MTNFGNAPRNILSRRTRTKFNRSHVSGAVDFVTEGHDDISCIFISKYRIDRTNHFDVINFCLSLFNEA